MPTIYTIGHSTQRVEALLDALLQHEIASLWDIRRYPASRRNPQYNSAALARSLADAGIDYRHVPDLGGRREPASDSINTGLRDEGFRGFADYESTALFTEALDILIEATMLRRTVIMCAEAVPWRCHRSLISDALLARDVPVRHIIGATTKAHTLPPHAHVDAGRVTYPSLI